MWTMLVPFDWILQSPEQITKRARSSTMDDWKWYVGLLFPTLITLTAVYGTILWYLLE